MTKQEALDFLDRYTKKNHEVVYTVVGPSHGDSGGYSTITKACPCVIHDWYSIKVVDETKTCSCGAREHNMKVDEAIKALST